MHHLKKDFEQIKNIVKHKVNNIPVNSFEDYLNVVSPEFQWDWKHLVYIRNHIRQIEDGRIKRLLISCPPRHGKSEMTTIRFPCYWLDKRPQDRVIIAAYNQFLANKFSRRIRRLVSERMVLSSDRTAVEEWETPEYGGVRAVGVGAGITGQGGNLIIIDDPVKSHEEANSKVYRERVWSWYMDDLYTRLEPGAVIILIMTRWHEDDLAGRILQNDKLTQEWTTINLPALALEDDLLGRKPDEPLCPERYNKDDLKRIKLLLGNEFEALFQGNPTAETGEIFKTTNFNAYNHYEINNPKFILQTWDTAFKTGEENDYTVGITFYFIDNKFYLVNRWKDRVAFSAAQNAIQTQAAMFKPDAILIEDKASGQSLIQEFKLRTSLPVLPFKPERDKISRACAVTSLIDGGQVFLPSAADWRNDFLENLKAFPYGKHDDDVDAFTMGLTFLMNKFAFGANDDFDYKGFTKFSKF